MEKNIREGGKPARLGGAKSRKLRFLLGMNGEIELQREREREGCISAFSRDAYACLAFFLRSSSPPRRLLSTPFGREERKKKLASLPSLRCTHPRIYFFLPSSSRGATQKLSPFSLFGERNRLDSSLFVVTFTTKFCKWTRKISKEIHGRFDRFVIRIGRDDDIAYKF